QNPDPKIVEVTLVAIPAVWEFRPGVPTLVWSLNGTIPGPTIEANVGDELIVHFTNLIDTPGGIHWHGVEVPATMDGSHASNAAIPLGGSFEYRFRVNRASLFWYHPHHDSAEQVERGLYGALLVHDPPEVAAALPANERIVVLDDVVIDADGQFETFEVADPVGRATYQANGREGSLPIVNGRAGRTLPVENGVPLRLRVVNTANTRFMRLNVPGHELHLIGTDGGLLEAPQTRAEIGEVEDPDPSHCGQRVSDNDASHGVLATPGERVDVVLTPAGESGALLPVEWHDWGRGRHFYYKQADGEIALFHVHGAYPSLPPEKLFDLQLTGDPQASDYTLPNPLGDLTPLDTTNAQVLKLTMGHGNPNADGDISFWMQEKDGTPLPFPLVGSADANQATVGQTAIWEVKNTAHGDHNFHTHGFMFQPLSIEYVSCDPSLNRIETFDAVEEKDTIRIPGPPMPACTGTCGGPTECPICAPGTAYTILRAAVRFDDAGREHDIEAYGKFPQPDRSGGWMIHCHLLEHAESGMMTYFELRKPN
ncbi:MAG: multicopper oxidase family protein, partial [Candidatus Binatia bacterium]